VGLAFLIMSDRRFAGRKQHHRGSNRKWLSVPHMYERLGSREQYRSSAVLFAGA
jgi:hypothetical protein